MSQFKVKTQGLRNVVNEEENIEKQIFDIYSEVIQQKNSISFKVAATGNVRRRLENVSSQIHSEGKTLQKMKKKLADAADKYERTEDTICKVSEDNKVTNWEKIINYDWLDGVPKTIGKMLLDIISKAGDIGGSFTWLTTLLKIAMDGNGFSPKDTGALIKGSGTSLMKIMDSIKHYNDNEMDKLWGLDEFKTITIDSQAGWLQNAGTTFKDTFIDQFVKTDKDTGAVAIKGTKAAGWILSFIANGFSNYEEYQKGGITGGRAVAETVTETAVDILKGAAITAGVAALAGAGAAALGAASVPAVVVAGAGVVVSSAADYVTKKLTGALMGEEKSLTEFVSDGILDLGTKAVDGITDWGKKAMDGITGAWSSAKEAMCGWGRQLGFA